MFDEHVHGKMCLQFCHYFMTNLGNKIYGIIQKFELKLNVCENICIQYIQLKWSKCFECPQNTAYLKMQKSDLQKDKTARKYILKESCAMMEQASLDRWNQNELAPTCDEGVVHDPQYTTSSAKHRITVIRVLSFPVFIDVMNKVISKLQKQWELHCSNEWPKTYSMHAFNSLQSNLKADRSTKSNN